MKWNLSQIIAYQNNEVERLMGMMKSPKCYPFKGELAELLEYPYLEKPGDDFFIATKEKEAYKADELEIALEHKEHAEKQWNLSEVTIDIVGSLLQKSVQCEYDIGGGHFILLSETTQMPGHVNVINIRSGKILTNVHSYNFDICRPMDT